MIISVDAQIVNFISEVTRLPASSIVYGTYNAARRAWMREPKNKGVANLPYACFSRAFDFALMKDTKTVKVETGDASNPYLSIKFTPCVITYTIEFLSATVVEQMLVIKNYFFRVSEKPNIKFTDVYGRDWTFGLESEPPQDNTDLDAEEENDRIIRTTLTFRLEVQLTNVTQVTAIIKEILSSILNYDGLSLLDQFTIR